MCFHFLTSLTKPRKARGLLSFVGRGSEVAVLWLFNSIWGGGGLQKTGIAQASVFPFAGNPFQIPLSHTQLGLALLSDVVACFLGAMQLRELSARWIDSGVNVPSKWVFFF